MQTIHVCRRFVLYDVVVFVIIIIISFSRYDLLKLIDCFVNAVVVVGPTIKKESMSGKTY